MKKQKKSKKEKESNLVPITCACCKKCWLDLDTGYCIYGGPYKGYYYVETK